MADTAPQDPGSQDASSQTVRYQVVVGKNDVRESGAEDAAVDVTVPLEVASADGFDPVVAYMRGELKASGHTGVLLDALTSGAAATAISALVAG